MYSSILKEHQNKQSNQRETTEMYRKNVIDAAQDLTETLVDRLNVGVATIYTKQREIDNQMKELLKSSVKLSEEMNAWETLFQSLSNAFKPLGDIENWTENIERDLTDIQNKLISLSK